MKSMIWTSLAAASLCLLLGGCGESGTSGEKVEPKAVDPSNQVDAPGQFGLESVKPAS